MKVLRYTLLSCAAAGVLTSVFWTELAVLTAPARTAQASDSELSRLANRRFWEVFHAGQYQRADEALELLQAAWFQNPRDPVLVSHMAWAHLWQLSERGRLETLSPRILDHMVLSHQYFAEALALSPGEPRYTGFLADLEMTVAAVTDNEALGRQGYFRGLKSIELWPEFNYFTVAYVLTGNLPPDHERFTEAIEMLWRNNAVCGIEDRDRSRPDLSEFLAIDAASQPERWRRACINSWIAPYNLEGYLLAFADALVKSGDWRAGTVMYEQIRRTGDFSTWPYAALLNERVRNAQANVARFSADHPQDGRPSPPSGMMFGSGYACMGCHQHSEASRAKHSPPEFVAKTL